MGDCRVPGLVLGDILIVFQVSLLSQSGVITVDMAVKYRGRWCVLEVDGTAPIAELDPLREYAVRKLLTVRVCNGHLGSPDFAAIVSEVVRQAICSPAG